jgi:hypothetical protein
MSCRDGDRRRSALDILPVALQAGYVVVAVHGLLMLTGVDLVWWGPSLSREQCFGAVVTYLAGRLWYAADKSVDKD